MGWRFKPGNPVGSKQVERYLEAMIGEQAISHGVVRPMFFFWTNSTDSNFN